MRTRVAEALHGDPGSGLHDVAGVITMAGSDAARAEAVWKDAVEGRLPDTPDELREALATRGASAPAQHASRTMIDAVPVKEREAGDDGATATSGARCEGPCTRRSPCAAAGWRSTTCGRALEDAAARLPTSFLAALHVLGDASCLEPLAAAWGAAEPDTTADGLRWRQQLAAAFQAIAQREKITKRHAVMKTIAARWPGSDVGSRLSALGSRL